MSNSSSPERGLAPAVAALSRPTTAAAVLVALALTTTSCWIFSPPPEADIDAGVVVVNNTDSDLHFRIWKEDGEWLDLATQVDPGETAQLVGTMILGEDSLIADSGCTTGPVEALDADDRVVATHPPGLCIDDSWVIED